MDGELVFFLVVLPHRFSNPAPENLREAVLLHLYLHRWMGAEPAAGRAPDPRLLGSPLLRGPAGAPFLVHFLASQPTPLTPDPRHTTPLHTAPAVEEADARSPRLGPGMRPLEEADARSPRSGQACGHWKKLTLGAPGRARHAPSGPGSFLAWGPRVVHGWRKCRGLGAWASARGHPGGSGGGEGEKRPRD